MSKGISKQQAKILEIIKQRDAQNLVTSTEHLVQATGRVMSAIRRSLQSMEQRQLVMRADYRRKPAVWTCRQRLALMYRGPAMTCVKGSNADLMEQVARAYLPPESTVADVTYGIGRFWRKVDLSKFRLLKSDILPQQPGILRADFRLLPYHDEAIDVVILDPPYMHGGQSIMASINDCYRNDNHNGNSIMETYQDGIAEAHRVLKNEGLIMMKVGDEVESGRRQFRHMAVHSMLEAAGFQAVDLFILMRTSIPPMRHPYQLHPRTNHSFLWVAQKAGRLKPGQTLKTEN